MFKIKDGVRIGTVDVFNNSGVLLVNAPTASKLLTAASITLSGDVTGTVNFDGSAGVTITTTIAENSVALGTDTTGNYVASVSAGTGISVTGEAGEGSTPQVALSHLGLEALVDPNGNRILYWNDAVNATAWLEVGSGLSIVEGVLVSDPDNDTSYSISAETATGGANLRLTGSDATTDDVKFVGAGIAVVERTDADTITITATEADTLETVTGRGASSTNAISITNSTASTSTTSGALTVTGGVGIGGDVFIGADLAVNGGDLTTSATTATLFNANATTLNVGGAATTISVGAATGTTTVNNDLVVSGNLTIQGSTTTLETTTLLVEDKNIEIGVVETPTDTTANGGGITLKGATDKTFNWLSATTSWTSSENIDLASTKVFKIAGNEVLSSTALGTGVVSSSLTSVGTLTQGTWNATTIGVLYGGTGQTSYTDGQLLIGNSTGNTLTKATLTAGTNVTITNGNGSITIASTDTDTTYAISTTDGSNSSEKIIRLTEGGSGSGTDDIILAVANTGSTAGLTINQSNDKITFAHADTSTLSGEQGTAGIASITVDEMGHVTAVSTATYLTAESDTLASVTARGATTADAVSLTNTTDSTSSSTGALVVSGGVAVSKDVFVSGSVVDATSAGVAVAYNTAVQATVESTSPTQIDAFPLATFRSGKYLIQISQGSNYQVSEFRVIHNGTATFITEYSVLETNGPLGNIAASISGSDVVIAVTMGASDAANFNIQRTLVVV
jgi:hypothetical protein